MRKFLLKTCLFVVFAEKTTIFQTFESNRFFKVAFYDHYLCQFGAAVKPLAQKSPLFCRKGGSLEKLIASYLTALIVRVLRSCIQKTSLLLGEGTFNGMLALESFGMVRASVQRWMSEWPSANANVDAPL